jgi:hypothetical protein
MTKPGAITWQGDPNTPVRGFSGDTGLNAHSGDTGSQQEADAENLLNSTDLNAPVKKSGKQADSARPAPSITEDIASKLAPEQAQASALPDEYASAIAQINALPSGDQGPNAALNASVDSETAALKGGEGAIAKSLAQMGPDVAAVGKDLPYADVLATTLNQKKNELLYGTSAGAILPTAATDNWPTAIQNVYNYLKGAAPAGTSTGIQGLSGAQLPGVTTAAQGGGGSGTSIPTDSSNPAASI